MNTGRAIRRRVLKRYARLLTAAFDRGELTLMELVALYQKAENRTLKDYLS